DRCFGCCEAFRSLPSHQAHPVVSKSSCATFPCARLVRRDCGQDEGINIVLAAGLDEYFSESARDFRVKQVRIDRAEKTHIVLCGVAKYLRSQRKGQYSPSSHAPLPLPNLG